jgi:hypothetical protein
MRSDGSYDPVDGTRRDEKQSEADDDLQEAVESLDGHGDPEGAVKIL